MTEVAARASARSGWFSYSAGGMGERLGKYQLERKLGAGGMAEVWLARAEGPGGFSRQVVVKRIHAHLLEEPRFVEMFLGEASLVARLSHPNIVQLFDFGEDNGTPYLAMEWMDGPNLKELLRREKAEGRVLPAEMCARLVAMACEGLAYAHEAVDAETRGPLGLVHRDVSPDNLLLSSSGALKVADFGIARSAVQKHRTKTGTVKGKLAYMAPEQLRSEPLDGRADQYSLGVVLYELLAGTRPYDVKGTAELMRAVLQGTTVPLSQRRPDVPAELARIAARAMETDRARRFPDCRELQRALESWLMRSGHTFTAWDVAQWLKSPPTVHVAPELGKVADFEDEDEELPGPGGAAEGIVTVPPAVSPVTGSALQPTAWKPRPWVAVALGVLLFLGGWAWTGGDRGTEAPAAFGPPAPVDPRPASWPVARTQQQSAGESRLPRAAPDAGTGETSATLYAAAEAAAAGRRHAEAGELARTCLGRNSRHVGCRILSADALVWAADSAEAGVQYKRALEDSRAGGSVPAARLAQVKAWLERYERVRALLWRARVSQGGKATGEALAEFQQCVGLAPDVPECHKGNAEALLSADRAGPALREFQRYLELAPLAYDAVDIREKISELAPRGAVDSAAVTGDMPGVRPAAAYAGGSQAEAKERGRELPPGEDVRVVFSIKPDARVAVDGVDYGDSRFLDALRLRPGKHQLRLTNLRLNKQVNLEFEARLGEDNIIQHDLERD